MEEGTEIFLTDRVNLSFSGFVRLFWAFAGDFLRRYFDLTSILEGGRVILCIFYLITSGYISGVKGLSITFRVFTTFPVLGLFTLAAGLLAVL